MPKLYPVKAHKVRAHQVYTYEKRVMRKAHNKAGYMKEYHSSPTSEAAREISERTGLPYHTVYSRLHLYGWSVEEAADVRRYVGGRKGRVVVDPTRW